MTSARSSRIISTVNFVIEKIAEGQFDELAKVAKTPGYSIEDFKAVLIDYGIDVTANPIGADALSIVGIEGDTPRSWSVWLDLVDRLKGPTDLQLRLTLIENHEPIMDIEIDGVLVA